MRHQPGLDIPPPTLVFDPAAEGVHVDLRRLVAGRLVASASSGGGKGWLARYLLESTATEIPQFVVDWDGEYPSLKAVAPYVWVGDPEEGADLPVSTAAARLQCRRLMPAGASVVLDLSSLGVDDRRRVVGLWLDELMAPRAAHPRLVLIDEAHEFAPQGADVESSAALKRLVSQGRKRGFGAVLLTQRLSKLNKDVAEAANRMIGRTILDVDVRRAADELGLDKNASQTLKRLRPGRWYAFGPAIQDGEGVVLCQAGETRSAYPDGTLATIAVPTSAEIAEALKGLGAEGEAVADDAGREELLEEIERLQAALKAAKEGDVSDPADVARAIAAAVAPLQDRIRWQELRIERCLHHARAIFLGVDEIPPTEETTVVQTSAPQAPAKEPAEVGTLADQLSVLEYLRGRGDVAKDELAKALGYSNARSGKFRPIVAELRRRGLVEYPGGRFVRLVEDASA